MNTTNNHSANPSYLGDITHFSFPNSKDDLQMDSQDKIIERAGSIFIKSIPKVLPFPKDDASEKNITPAVIESKDTSDVNTFNKNEVKVDNLTRKNNLIAKRPSLKPVNSTRQSKPQAGYLRNSLLRKYHEQLATGKLPETSKSTDLDKKDSDNLTKLNSLRSLHTLRSVRSNKSLNSFILHRENSVQNSIFSKFNEEETKKIKEKSIEMKNRFEETNFNENQTLVNIAKTNSEIPKKTSLKAVNTFQDIPENEAVDENAYTTYNPDMISISNIESLEIPRRSSKRLRQKPSLAISGSRKHNKLNTISRRKRLNGNSVRSIQTLATEIRTDLHKSGFKSVDFANLDLLLQELLLVTEDKTDSQSIKSVRNKSLSRKTTYLGSRKSSCSIGEVIKDGYKDNGSTKNASRVSSCKVIRKHNGIPSIDSEVSEFQIIKPFELRNSLNRRISVKRSLSMLSSEIKQINSDKDSSRTAKNVRDCELKRRNAIKRKPRIVELLINLVLSLKQASKKIWCGITKSSKKIRFKKNSTNRTKNNISGKQISQPTLVDITKTQFQDHNLHKSDIPIKTVPIMTTVNKVNNTSAGSLSTAESEDFDINGVEKDQLVVLWKHYLSNSVMNRVDMKLEAANAIQLQRIKSSQSVKTKRESIERIENEEVDRVLSKYVGSISSSKTSLTSDLLSLTGLSKKSASTFDADEINDTFDKVLFGDNESLAPTYSTFLYEKGRNVSSTSSWSTVSSNITNCTESTKTASDLTFSDSDTEHSSISTIEEEDSSYQSRSHASSISTNEDNGEQIDGKSILTSSFRVSNLKHSPDMLDLHSFHTARGGDSSSPSRTPSTFSFQPSVY